MKEGRPLCGRQEIESTKEQREWLEWSNKKMRLKRRREGRSHSLVAPARMAAVTLRVKAKWEATGKCEDINVRHFK